MTHHAQQLYALRGLAGNLRTEPLNLALGLSEIAQELRGSRRLGCLAHDLDPIPSYASAKRAVVCSREPRTNPLIALLGVRL